MNTVLFYISFFLSYFNKKEGNFHFAFSVIDICFVSMQLVDAVQ